MAAAIKNLLIEQGATFSWTLLFPQDPKRPTGPMVDLTGYSARMHIRAEVDSPVVLVDLSSAPGGGMVFDYVAGRLDIEITDVATSALAFEAAVYDLELVTPGGKVIRVFKGAVNLSLEVTRP